MSSDVLKFFNLQREIFGTCPECGEFFRLSDCKVYLKKKPVEDWMDRLEREEEQLAGLEERIDQKKCELQEEARRKGRKTANQIVRKIDPVFAPRRLNADDAKVIFHPVDYVVFCGMKEDASIRSVLFLDRKAQSSERRALQRTVEKVVERGNYDWVTLRIRDDGSIKEE